MVAPDVIVLVVSSLCLESAASGLGQVAGFPPGLFFFLRILLWASHSFLPMKKVFTIRKVSGLQTSESGLFFVPTAITVCEVEMPLCLIDLGLKFASAECLR